MPYRPAEETLVASVWMPRFEIQVEHWRRPDLKGLPIALFSTRPQPALVCCSEEAEAEGLKPGMLVREALATAPGAILQESDPYFYAEILDRMVSEMETISPLVEPVPPGSLFLCLEGLIAADSTGAVGLYHTRSEFVAALERAIRPEWITRVGIGRGKFVAWTAARTASRDAEGVVLSHSGVTGWVMKKEVFLKPLPVQLLPVSPEMGRKLLKLGLRTLGQLAALPLSAMLAQFGKEGRRAWMLSRGVDEEPIRPRKAPAEIKELLEFDAPEAGMAALFVAVQQLLERALKRPERQGRFVRQIRIEAVLESGRTWMAPVNFKQPGTLPATLFPPIRYRLEREPPPEAIQSVALVLAVLANDPVGQGTLFVEPQEVRRRRLVEAMSQLRSQMGSVLVSRVVEVEPWSRIPERRHQLISYDP